MMEKGDASAGRLCGDPGVNRLLARLTQGRVQMGMREYMSEEVFRLLSSHGREHDGT